MNTFLFKMGNVVQISDTGYLATMEGEILLKKDGPFLVVEVTQAKDPYDKVHPQMVKLQRPIKTVKNCPCCKKDHEIMPLPQEVTVSGAYIIKI